MHFIWLQKNLLTEDLITEQEHDNADNIRTIIKMNPEYETSFYDAACHRECRTTGIDGVLNLYEYMREATSFGLSRWANMANVCRIAVLYNHGGIYMDTNMQMRLPFKEWLSRDADYVANLRL